jgi:selenocysteine-specific elongation factor
MPIVGTAGHVDHGKSTLIQALTGRDPDRLAEEKERGLTIDLGFAWTTLPSGASVGFVDVPGHERFIKNMLAGIDAVNVGLLVVAADEGWMPQSEEHLAVLDLLEIPHVVVALTRTGLADEEVRELAVAEVEEQLVGTVAEHAPIIPVDSLTGDGLDLLVDELDAAIAATTVPDFYRPRMWVDRSFTIRGAGTVVTGTLLDGGLRTGEEVTLFPAGETARIRTIQSHEESRESAEPGSRTALNLAGIDGPRPERGAMVGRPGEWVPTTRFVVTLHTVRHVAAPIRDRGAYHLHVGSGAWPARLRLLDGPELVGHGHAVVTTTQPIPLTLGDRFVLREVGRRAVVGGGRVIEPDPPGRVRHINFTGLERLVGAEPNTMAAGLLQSRGSARAAVLSAHSRGGMAADALRAGDFVLDSAEAGRLTDAAVTAVEDYQVANPLRPGMPKASLASRLGVDLELVAVLITRSDRLMEAGATVTTVGHAVVLSPGEEAAWAAARQRLAAGLTVPPIPELGLSTELVYALERSGSLVRVSGRLAYLPEQIEQFTTGLGDLAEEFTVAEFRDHFGLTRKYAVPVVEWLDAEGYTVRKGDLRSVRSR